MKPSLSAPMLLAVACLLPRTSTAEERVPATAPAASSSPSAEQRPIELALAAYVRRYLALSDELRAEQIRLQQQGVEIARARQRGTRELSAEPSFGLHHFAHNHSLGSDTLLLNRTTAEYRVLRDNGQSWSVEAHASLPTTQGLPPGNLQYGLSGSYLLPLWRNRWGRQFELEVEVQEQLLREGGQRLSLTRLDACQDAAGRYVEAYVAQQQLAVYRELLEEKRKIWRQTAADYRRRMITRLDLLAAKSDWLEARSQEPELVARAERADAALRAYYPDAPPLRLSEPAALVVPPLEPSSVARAVDERQHPRFAALIAEQQALALQQTLVVEQNRSDLDLGLSLGLDRYHEAIFAAGDPASTPPVPSRVGDTTDIFGLVSLRYLWPVARPDVAFRVRLLGLERRRLDEERARLRREIVDRAQQALAAARGAAAAAVLTEEQVSVAEQQIKAAYAEFRAGKLQFQNFLDHWERYQRARLQLWDARRQRWLAAAELIPLLNRLPEFCR